MQHMLAFHTMALHAQRREFDLVRAGSTATVRPPARRLRATVTRLWHRAPVVTRPVHRCAAAA